MKEEWLFPGAIVSVDVETTSALVVEIKRLIDVVGGMALAQPKQQAEPVCPECKAAVLYECVACSSNNYPTQQQEPVLWAMPDGKIADKWALQFYSGQKGKPLYTAPPQRPWVGLTPEEVLDLFDLNNVYGSKWIEFARTVEAALRSKNT